MPPTINPYKNFCDVVIHGFTSTRKQEWSKQEILEFLQKTKSDAFEAAFRAVADRQKDAGSSIHDDGGILDV